MTIYGLDVSNHQGNLTGFGGVATSFLCHKLTEGTSYTDPYAAHNLAFARDRKVPVLGGYHYVRAGNGSGQADHFADRARELFGHDLRGHLWQLDCEDDASWADVKAFKQQWDKGTDHAPILFYTGDWWLQPRGWNVASLGFAGLWAAPNRGYVGKAQNVKTADWAAGYGGYKSLTICQYDARASVGDTNQYRGTVAQLRALLAGDKGEDDDMQLTDQVPLADWITKEFPDLANTGKRSVQVLLASGYGHARVAEKTAKETAGDVATLTKRVDTMAAQLALVADPTKLAAALKAAGVGAAVDQAELEAALRNVLGSLNDTAA